VTFLTRLVPFPRLLGAVVVASLAAAGCTGGPAPSPHAVLTASGDPLRAQFNRDAGHVRVVILAAPT
jgi:hypothetical protein